MEIFEEHEVRAMLESRLREHGVKPWARQHGFARGSSPYLVRIANASLQHRNEGRPFRYRVTDRVLRALNLRRVYVRDEGQE